MKKILIILSVAALSTLISQAQWVVDGDEITTTDQVGIGTSTPKDESNLDIQSSFTTGYKVNLYSINQLSGDKVVGKTYSRICDATNWPWGGSLFGVMGYLTDVTFLKLDNSTKTSWAMGGNFGATISDPIQAPGTGTYKIAGARTYINGSITTYPNSGVVTALYSQDLISGTNTWAGFFEGRAHFSESVAIGTTTTTDALLTVDGTIEAERIDVLSDISLNGMINAGQLRLNSTVPQSDHVFDTNYNLMSLSELGIYIKNHKHLPEVPSAKEFKEDGYSVGEMDDLLLRKIEELTLYILELETRIKELETK